MLERKSNILIRIISTITHENSIENIETSEICNLTTFNDEELLWKLRLGILMGQDSDNFWKILQLYMKNDANSQQTSLSMKDIERIFLKFFQKDQEDYQRIILFWEMLRKSNIKLNIEIRKNLGTISILGYFDGIYTYKSWYGIYTYKSGIYTMTGFMHDIYTIQCRSISGTNPHRLPILRHYILFFQTTKYSCSQQQPFR